MLTLAGAGQAVEGKKNERLFSFDYSDLHSLESEGSRDHSSDSDNSSRVRADPTPPVSSVR